MTLLCPFSYAVRWHVGQSKRVATPRASFGDVLRVQEFRWLWIAGIQSQAGDQLARVALSVLVFERTHSPLQTALIYALTFAPAIIGALTLSWLADRLPRRTVMVGCDLIRAGLLALMALPHVSTLVLSLLLVLAVLIGAPFGAASMALLPQVLGERFVVGSGLRMMSDQMIQVAGFAVGGAVVAAIGARAGLFVDAVSFAISALIISIFVRRRRVPTSSRSQSSDGIWASVASIMANPRLRRLLAFSWVAGFYIVPEALAAPYAHSVGAGASGTGLLMAAMPAGGAIGALLLVRYVGPAVQPKLVAPLAVAAGLPLALCWFGPGLGVSVMLWGLSGFASAYQVLAAALFVGLVPDTIRGRGVGLAASGLLAVQGLGSLLGGVLAEYLSVGRVVAIAGLAGVATATAVAVIGRRDRRSSGSMPASGRHVRGRISMPAAAADQEVTASS